MQEFMQTKQIDRASTYDGMAGSIEPEQVRHWLDNHSFSPTEHGNLLSLFADNNQQPALPTDLRLLPVVKDLKP